MNQQTIPYEKCILVCVNDKAKVKPSCGDHQGEAIFRKLRDIAKAKGLHPRIRVTQAKCLGQCELGCNLMIYPSGEWYSKVELRDVENLSEKLFRLPSH